MNTQTYTPPENTGLTILYQDEALLALDKPSGLLSVPGRGEDKQDCLISRVQVEYPDALVIHRLDMETSGLILVAKHPMAQRAIGQLFEQRRITKKYTAIVNGQLTPATGKIDLPLIADWPNRPRQIVDLRKGKTAQTTYTVMHYDEQNNCTRVELMPQTGRSHQLRVHMQALGHPILGDRLYGTDNSTDRLLLHATLLAFSHPVTGQALELNSKVPF